MKLHEALSKSTKVRRSCWLKELYFDYTCGEVLNHNKSVGPSISNAEYQADDWEPIFEKKKMYQALLRYEDGACYITPFLYADETSAKEVYNKFFVKLLIDRPVEVEET